MRAFAKSRGTVPRIVRDYALPIAEAQLAHAAGRYTETIAMMRPIIGDMYRLGGSHAQQDVLEQLFVDAALKAGSSKDIRLALKRAAGLRAIPLERFVGWREAVNRAAAFRREPHSRSREREETRAQRSLLRNAHHSQSAQPASARIGATLRIRAGSSARLECAVRRANRRWQWSRT